MKRIIISLGLLFAMQGAIFAQLTDSENIVFNAHLLKTFSLNVLNGATQEITFTTAADYNNGVIEGAGIASGTTDITIEATGDWDLTILCPDFVPYAGPNGLGTGTIPIDNLGVWLVATGTHQFGTEISCPYTSLATALGLDNASQTLINLVTENSGDASDNAFTLHWQMGQAAACPLMNPATMFDQMAINVFGPGDFTTTAVLTITEQ
jgi:hypothetical protein